LSVFYEQPAVPSHSCLLMDDPHAARDFPRGDLRLALCEACGFISNRAYDPALAAYSESYEEVQDFSPHFSAWLEGLAKDLVDRHDLHDKVVLEIGCGKGRFLELVCRFGPNRGVGIDPASVPERVAPDVADRMRFLKQYYAPEHARLDADMIACRHTLEHVPGPAELLGLIAETTRGRPDTVIFFDLPDVMRVLREGAFWDIYYEHCSYFTAGSLARLFRRAGFDVTRLWRDYDDQYLLVEALPGGRGNGRAFAEEESAADVADAAQSFSRALRRARDEWGATVRAHASAGRRVIVWGSGSKGVAFLTTLGLEDEVAEVVDINPHKQGKFMAGTGHPIVAPEALTERPPDVVIAMNPVYGEEIRRSLRDLGIDAELMAV
jgi:SAM-dependent methyltransferase